MQRVKTEKIVYYSQIPFAVCGMCCTLHVNTEHMPQSTLERKFSEGEGDNLGFITYVN